MSDLPTRLEDENTTQVASCRPDPVFIVRTAGGTPERMHLIFRGGSRSGTLMEIRADVRRGLFLVRTADRPDAYLVEMHPEMGQKIIGTWLRSDPSRAYAARLASSMQRQQEEARRRLLASD